MSTATTTTQPASSSNVKLKTTDTITAKKNTSDELVKSNKDDDTCDDWEQLDQIVIIKTYIYIYWLTK